jgi:hypothetical protein
LIGGELAPRRDINELVHGAEASRCASASSKAAFESAT